MKNATRNPVVHFEVLGRDTRALRNFYAGVFGWELGPVDGSPLEYSMVHFGGGAAGVDGGIGKAPEGSGHVTFYISVDDLAEVLADIERAGGKTIQPPTPIPSGASFALFADPEGHVLGLLQQ